MRGTRRFPLSAGPQPRIIPEDAGSTLCILSTAALCRDHPRGCGEHINDTHQPLCELGSSPRMRGAPGENFAECVSVGIIPADAGSTIIDGNGADCSGDHPRGCGEHSAMSYGRWTSGGSSPRMRGARQANMIRMIRGRIIPADAGSTCSRKACGCLDQDHPRGCGEHCRSRSRAACLAGSSPRMRGARCLLTFCVVAAGIIPADAGSTWCSLWLWLPPRDHPRGCGEHKYCVCSKASL